MEDEKYIESWNKTLKLLGIEMKLEDLEIIYNEFAKKIEEVVNDIEINEIKKK
jgi:5,10-methylene-tetrahydrofolate dehydrogenase/methenyl tetrahydrofolate cyclohydrolase